MPPENWYSYRLYTIITNQLHNNTFRSGECLLRIDTRTGLINIFVYTHKSILSVSPGEHPGLFLFLFLRRNLIIAEIYRIPNTNERQSIARYDEVMSSLVNTKCDILLGTDQNFDYVKVNSNGNVSELLDVFFTQGILPTITKPTRITHSSATLIDKYLCKM